MRDTKTEIISEKITKLRGDTKNLYSLVYQLIGNEKKNPLPEKVMKIWQMSLPTIS